MKVGILAYGSLIDTPGAEIAAALLQTLKREILTPFKVEFARESQKRGGAPTLVPVEVGGANVRAQIHVVKVNTQDASDMLWRRERNIVGELDRKYLRPENPGKNHVLIDALQNFHGVATVLYSALVRTSGSLQQSDLQSRLLPAPDNSMMAVTASAI